MDRYDLMETPPTSPSSTDLVKVFVVVSDLPVCQSWNSSLVRSLSGSVALPLMVIVSALPTLMYGEAEVSQEPGLMVTDVGVFGFRL